MVVADTLDPFDATPEKLAELLEGRPLRDPRRYHKDDWCARCDEKNSVRMMYDDLERRDETFDDGERIRIIGAFGTFENPDEQLWQIRGAFHLRHPHLSMDEVAVQGEAQFRATARLVPEGYAYDTSILPNENRHYIDGDAWILRDVEVDTYSPPDEGVHPDETPDPEPDPETGTIVLERTDPRPHWPDEENEWRERVMRDHDDWTDKLPTFHFGAFGEVEE